MANKFSDRFKVIYEKYAGMIEVMGGKASESGMARFLGVSQTTMQRWKNYQMPAPESLKVIHDKLGFSYDWLITGEGEQFDESAQVIAAQKAEIERLEAENRKLNTRQSQDVMTDEKSVAITAKAVGQE